MNTTHKNYMES